MSKVKNILGFRYGRLKVVSITNKREYHGVVWKCKCDCGNIRFVSSDSLSRGATKSCGCLYNERLHDLTDRRFGKLTVLKITSIRKFEKIVWKCKCDCGAICFIASGSLLSGNSKSCGCWRGREEDFVNKVVNNVRFLRKSKERYYNRWKWETLCPNCKQPWIVSPSDVRRKVSMQCKKCSLGDGESKVADLLLDKVEKYIGLPVMREYKIRNKFFDGYIPQLKILIESDGTYWHSSKRAKINDAYKNRLAKSAGLKLIRVTNNTVEGVNNVFEIVKKELSI